ncbi:MAG: catechol 1,2-dioxygenase [Rhizobiales bacterium]|nr:catechol 1,2-dioxygenase [Hyphomicrobiales bacterium]
MPYVTEQNLTDIVKERWTHIPDPRLRKIMASLVKNLHVFVREIEPTEAEWAATIDWLTRTGKMCTEKRQEFILTSDVLGVSMLVDAINHRLQSKATPTTVEGPFHIPGSPEFADGENMAEGAPGIPCFVTGIVRDLDGKPVAGARLDLWQTDGEGLYEAQRDEKEAWMRGVYHSNPDGSYTVQTVAPIGYTIPMDGTVGELMERTTISHFRPAHIHFCIEAAGYHRVVTHLFQRGDQYIDTDVVYGVKEPLIVDFIKKTSGKTPTGETLATPFYEVRYDFVLQRKTAAQKAA